MIFYFLSGYLVVAMLFLAIGSLSDSMQDAQSYLTPVLILIMLPVVFTIQTIARNPDAAFVHVLSLIPLYTPFADIMRLSDVITRAMAVDKTKRFQSMDELRGALEKYM